ncbi:MAG TPA: Crp/Fnr family transcriptional regulator [Polyangiaceae bacterium]|nr:Crp/Fnr family transcriptional regulator [Polyangiaceae bacterium]
MSEADREAPASGPSSGDIAPQERARLLGRYGRRFVAGDSLFQEGAPAHEAFLLQEGRVRLLKRVAMTDRSIAVIKPGDLFGEGALLDGSTYGATAVALTDGTVLALDRGTFRALLSHHPQVATRVVDQLVARLRDAEDQLEIMMLRSVQSKVTSALLKLAGRATGAAEINVSPVDLSTRVGLDVEAVKRTVGRLREQQNIRIHGERIEIPDVEALRRLCTLLGTKDELAGPE